MNRLYRYCIGISSFASVFVLTAASTAMSGEQHMSPLRLEKQDKKNAIRVAAQKEVATVSIRTKSIVERLKPGEDFQSALKRIASTNNLKAGVIVSAVGSLTTASLRFAGAEDATTIEGPLEVVSATGTISDKGMHVHLSVSDSSGKTIGGHLMPGCKVFTTIELVILDLGDEWSFDRKTDEQTKYLELEPRKTSDKQ
jgi:uncharacterized protein